MLVKFRGLHCRDLACLRTSTAVPHFENGCPNLEICRTFPLGVESTANTGDASPMAQKIAFITGGNRGLGFQTALDLGKNKEENIKVVIGSRDKAQGEQAVTKLRAAGIDADTIQFDITNLADYQAAYNYFDSKYGKLDILVNNAGIAGGKFPGEGPEHR